MIYIYRKLHLFAMGLMGFENGLWTNSPQKSPQSQVRKQECEWHTCGFFLHRPWPPPPPPSPTLLSPLKTPFLCNSRSRSPPPHCLRLAPYFLMPVNRETSRFGKLVRLASDLCFCWVFVSWIVTNGVEISCFPAPEV